MPKDQRERGNAGKAATRRNWQEEMAYSANQIAYPAPHRRGKQKKIAFFPALSFLINFTLMTFLCYRIQKKTRESPNVLPVNSTVEL